MSKRAHHSPQQLRIREEIILLRTQFRKIVAALPSHPADRLVCTLPRRTQILVYQTLSSTHSCTLWTTLLSGEKTSLVSKVGWSR
uniref:Uncharacterized protein n=1 Tax=Physcomitrium patens TaxID=3218 RepID=A0A2K1JD10_PHYPA|nr:hypothetical protein PHYPA_019693 [Physcomitrium patens]